MRVQIIERISQGKTRTYENVSQITSVDVETRRYVNLVFQEDDIEDEQFPLDDYDFDIMGGYGG